MDSVAASVLTTSGADSLRADYTAKQHPSFGLVAMPVPAPTPADADIPEDASYDPAIHRHMTRALDMHRPWAGTPIRAIVPLPRRMRDKLGAAATTTTSASSSRGASRPARFCDDRNVDSGSDMIEEDSDDDDGDAGGDARDQGSDDDRDATTASRYCSYESITAAQGLSAWSFEELRVECYAQSLVARGTKPPPVDRPSLAIPPAFVPRVVPQS